MHMSYQILLIQAITQETRNPNDIHTCHLQPRQRSTIFRFIKKVRTAAIAQQDYQCLHRESLILNVKETSISCLSYIKHLCTEAKGSSISFNIPKTYIYWKNPKPISLQKVPCENWCSNNVFQGFAFEACLELSTKDGVSTQMFALYRYSFK